MPTTSSPSNRPNLPGVDYRIHNPCGAFCFVFGINASHGVITCTLVKGHESDHETVIEIANPKSRFVTRWSLASEQSDEIRAPQS